MAAVPPVAGSPPAGTGVLGPSLLALVGTVGRRALALVRPLPCQNMGLQAPALSGAGTHSSVSIGWAGHCGSGSGEEGT